MAKYNELKLGQKAEIRHIITPKDIDDFVELTGDDNKLHLDHEYASRTSFKKPVVHGMLGAPGRARPGPFRVPGECRKEDGVRGREIQSGSAVPSGGPALGRPRARFDALPGVRS